MKLGLVVEVSSTMISQSMCHSRLGNCQQTGMEGRSSVTMMAEEVEEWVRGRSLVVDVSQC